MAYNFAKAAVTETPEGDKSASVSCLNGAVPSPSISYFLSSSAEYYDGEPIEVGDVILFPVHVSSNTVDEGMIFPYNEETGDPFRIGGGIGKGNIIEEDESGTNLGVEVHWINGMKAAGTISNIASGALGSLPADTVVLFVMTIDENAEPEVLSATESEGTCGDVHGDSEVLVYFGASVPAGN